jgi:hypothetical protein
MTVVVRTTKQMKEIKASQVTIIEVGLIEKGVMIILHLVRIRQHIAVKLLEVHNPQPELRKPGQEINLGEQPILPKPIRTNQ